MKRYKFQILANDTVSIILINKHIKIMHLLAPLYLQDCDFSYDQSKL